MEQASVSDLTLRRLPKYLHFLLGLQKKKQEYTSASEISRHLEVHHTQVRKDLAFTGVRGIPKRGHKVNDLVKALEKYLNWDMTVYAILVGVGNLGTALLNYKGFETSGMQIVAAVDNDPQKAGLIYNKIKVFSIDKLPDLMATLNPSIAIISTTKEAAQKTAEKLIDNGIKGIWNFTPKFLDVPEDIIVENADIYPSLAVLVRKISELG